MNVYIITLMCQYFADTRLKVKVKVNVDLYSALSWTHLYCTSGIARVLKGFHSFTCTPRVHPLTDWTTGPTCLFLKCRKCP